jgi:hypothetical protein
MGKTMNVILGLAFLALGILGLTGVVPMFTRDPNYINIGEIVLGGFGLLVGIYARQNTKFDQQVKDFSKQTQNNMDWQRAENELLKKQNELSHKENYDRQLQENEQLRKQIDDQKKENESLSKH